jgi:hypothetical protein
MGRPEQVKRYEDRYPIADDTAANRQLMRYQHRPARARPQEGKRSNEAKCYKYGETA